MLADSRAPGRVRGSAVVSVFREDSWPSVRGSVGLAGGVVRFFNRVKHGKWDTVFSYVCGFYVQHQFCLTLRYTTVTVTPLEP